ncbi:MAG: hypothetical protein ACKO8U_14085 [Pirellula sp.]
MRLLYFSSAILFVSSYCLAQENHGPVRVSFKKPSLEDISTDPNGQIIRVPTEEPFGDVKPVQGAPKRTLKLGNRDDSLAESYSLENRGVETPTGKKTGRYCTDGCKDQDPPGFLESLLLGERTHSTPSDTSVVQHPLRALTAAFCRANAEGRPKAPLGTITPDFISNATPGCFGPTDDESKVV